jgi:hypothetical protein
VVVSGWFQTPVALLLTKFPTTCGALVAADAANSPKQLGGSDGAADAGAAVPSIRALMAPTRSTSRSNSFGLVVMV